MKSMLGRSMIAISMVATLLPCECHARLHEIEKNAVLQGQGDTLKGDTTQKIELQIISSENDLNNNIVLGEESMIINSIGDAMNNNKNHFFHRDFLYSFEPLEDGASVATDTDHVSVTSQKWKVQRIPKNTKTKRMLQEELTNQEQAIIANENDIGPVQPTNANEQQSNDDSKKTTMFYATNILLSLACVIMAALAAGLTMGMLSLDPLSLEIKRRASICVHEQERSAQLLPLLVGHSKRHRLLVSLLLLNSLANEALPLFLDEILPGKYAAIIVSVTLVLFFGEIVPSAFFTGPNQVEVAAKLVPLVKAVMFVLAPIAVPIARLLDRVLHDDDGSGGGGGNHGHDDAAGEDVTEGNFYNRTELRHLVRIQYESQLADKRRRKQEQRQTLLMKKSTAPYSTTTAGGLGNGHVSSHISVSERSSREGSVRSAAQHSHHSIRSIANELTASSRPSEDSPSTPLRAPSMHADEITMIEGALAMTTKRASDVCTPLRRVYALPTDTVLDEDTKVEIWARGYSRVPVYCPKEVEPDASAAVKSSTSSLDDIDISGIVGVMLVRQLIVVESAEKRPISTLPLVMPSCVSPSMHLVDLINMFQAAGGRGKGGLHLALVCARPNVAKEAFERGESIPKEAGVVGIVTLEDVVEELLQEEIYDEADRDLELSRWGIIKWKAYVKRRKLKRLQALSPSTIAPTTSETTPLLN